MSSILITGAGGFIGGALASRLYRDRGNRIVGLFRDKPDGWIRIPTNDPSFPDQGRSVAVFGDVVDTDLIQRVLADYRIDIVFHLAAEASVRACKEHPQSAFRSNVLGTASVLEACRRQGGIGAIVTASTDKVYGDGPVPYREDQPLLGRGVYAGSKVSADIAAQAFFDEYGLPVRIVRSCNVIGPGDADMTRIVPRSIDLMLRGKPAVLYEGAAEMVREFVHVEDEVDAYLAVAERGRDGEAYNVPGSGPVRVVEVMEALAKVCGGAYEVKPGGLTEIKEQWMDGSKLLALGWERKWRIDKALASAVLWHKGRLRL